MPEDAYMTIREIVTEIREDVRGLREQFHAHLREADEIQDRIDDLEKYKADRKEVVTKEEMRIAEDFKKTARRYLITTILTIVGIGIPIFIAVVVK